jgi:4-amino-4-deoxy-L-arabinose transferase-like glycosyltransferase
MAAPLVSRREAVVWTVFFVGVAALLVLLRFASHDPDSDLYAGLSARLAEQPISRWIAPEWWGLWPRIGQTGLYRDHPIGGFVVPALLGRLGVPGVQAAYIVGVGAGLAALLLIGHLVAQLSTRAEARAVLVLLQLMPVAFVFRIRANHEYAMLICLVVALLGIDEARRSWRGVWMVAAALAAGLLIKGAFVVLIAIGAGIWVVLNPGRQPGSLLGPVAAAVVGLAVLVAAAVGYDWWYERVTGETFWVPYWQLQLGQVPIATSAEGGSTLLQNVGFYLVRLLWHPAPWSLALVALARQRWSAGLPLWPATPTAARQGILFALGYAAILIVVLSPSSRIAERYIFSATYAIATAGIVAACRAWAGLATTIERLDRRVPSLPALLWLSLIVIRLSVGPWMTRI